ncbi:hypothetical protein IAU59_002922 [Kwoniella sp. CBS 9459]
MTSAQEDTKPSLTSASAPPCDPPQQTSQDNSQRQHRARAQDAIASVILASDVDDLLSGLGADDLDDFGDIDDADIVGDKSFESEPGSVGSFARGESDLAGSRGSIAGGFSLRGGNLLAGPSRLSVGKARQIQTEDAYNVPLVRPSQASLDDRERSKKPRLSDPSEIMPDIVGFTTGRGIAVPPPSMAALSKAARIFQDIDMQSEEDLNPIMSANAEAGPSRLLQASPQAGFTLASGKPAPKPSEASMARARKLMDGAGEGIGDEEEDHGEYEDGLYPSSVAQAIPLSDPPFTGFQLASGKQAPRPSAASLAKARQLMEEAANEAERSEDLGTYGGEDPFPPLDSGSPVPQLPPPSFGFQLASGKQAPPPSEASLAKARRLFDDDHDDPAIYDTSNVDGVIQKILPPSRPHHIEPEVTPVIIGLQSGPDRSGSTINQPNSSQTRPSHSDNELDTSQQSPTGFRTNHTTGFTLGSGKSAPSVNAGTSAAVKSLFNDSENLPSASISIPPSTGFKLGSGKPAVPSSQSSVAKAMNLFNDIDTNTAMPVRARPQPPIRASSPALAPMIRNRSGILPPTTPLRTPSATASTLSSIKRPIVIKTPSSSNAPRRIGLGSTPSQSRIKKGFNTPFKTPLSVRPTVPVEQKPIIHYRPVFDLTPPPDRQTYKSAYLHPQYYSIEELEDMKIPDEIWQIGPHNAALYCFYTDGVAMGHEEALATLRAESCNLVTARWVENHWVQVLWKIAGQIQAKPDLFLDKWSWHEVLSQLKYRYEREYGNAQRSILKRVQEHDSSPSLPMVLFVYAIEYGQGEDSQKCFIELSDGWYRIRALIDDCLLRAVKKGLIAVGRKLAVTGAKVESGNDGTEVLDAFKTSHLAITGNSTSLARWHTRLGLQSQPFIASLGSLSMDGGVVALMDIIVEKVFPIAFMTAGKGNKEAPWGEEEEQIRQDEWAERFAAERTRLEEAMRKELDKMEDLASLLAQSAEESDPVSDEPPDGLETDYTSLLEANDTLSRLRGMSSHHIVHLARFAQAKMNQEMVDKRGEIEHDLSKLCPERDVRDFRMVRFVDAQNGVREQIRVGMLNVWDVRALGEGTLQEGKRYLVSNLLPARSGEWTLKRDRTTKAEIYLHTRRDTRWQPV